MVSSGVELVLNLFWGMLQKLPKATMQLYSVYLGFEGLP